MLTDRPIDRTPEKMTPRRMRAEGNTNAGSKFMRNHKNAREPEAART